MSTDVVDRAKIDQLGLGDFAVAVFVEHVEQFLRGVVRGLAVDRRACGPRMSAVKQVRGARLKLHAQPRARCRRGACRVEGPLARRGCGFKRTESARG